MRRRHLLAAAGVAIVGEPIKNLGELLGVPSGPAPIPAPSRLDGVHVAKVRDLTRRLGEAGRAYGSDPEVSSAAAGWATRLLDVPGAEPVRQDLKAAVGALHIHAGRAAFDAGLADRTMYHYTRGLELATEAGDAYLQAVALAWSGLATEEHGHPDDGLKMLQFAQVKAWDIPPDHERVRAVEAWALADSATAYARLGDPAAAHTQLAKSRDLWRPKRTDTMGDLDIVAARIEVGRGRLDAAEPLAAASVRRWQGTSERARSQAGVVLATIHVRAGERGGLGLAHTAITAVSRLSSVRARKRLGQLADALDTRSGTDYQDLARMARQSPRPAPDGAPPRQVTHGLSATSRAGSWRPRSIATDSRIRAVHTRAKPASWPPSTVSPSTNTPMSSCRVGVRYCSRPSVDNGIRAAVSRPQDA